jgi:uncharacterized protein (TIGR00255 family)
MIRSMTGYGAASSESAAMRASVAIRSLNHRYLEIASSLSRRVASLEPEVKALVQSRVRRGKVEVMIRAAFVDGGGDVVAASPQVVAGLVRALREIRSEHGLAGEVAVADVARFPGALELVEAPGGPGEAARSGLLGLVARALDGLEAMRVAEGVRLAHELDERLSAIEAATCRIEALSDGSRAARREALIEKGRSLCGELGLDDARLYQEIVRLVDRNDVTEELVRLRSHLAQGRALLGADEPSGKRLDFLAQELMREANTIGSKAASAPLVQEVVALKTDVERLREQVQNVE